MKTHSAWTPEVKEVKVDYSEQEEVVVVVNEVVLLLSD